LSRTLLEQEKLRQDDQRKGDSEDHQHALVTAGLLLWIPIFSQVREPVSSSVSGTASAMPTAINHKQLNFPARLRH
jgi:hypothetical protein